MAESKEKSLAIAVIYNFFFMGAGYWYVSRKIIGSILMVVTVGMLIAIMNSNMAEVMFVCMPIHFFVWVVTSIDMFIFFKKLKNDNTVQCPRCAEKISKGATFCIHCKNDIVATA